MLLAVALFCLAVIYLMIVAWKDTVRLCFSDDITTLKVMISISIICKFILIYVIIGNYIISPMIAMGIKCEQLKYEEVEKNSSWWLNMNVIDELLVEDSPGE